MHMYKKCRLWDDHLIFRGWGFIYRLITALHTRHVQKKCRLGDDQLLFKGWGFIYSLITVLYIYIGQTSGVC